MKKFFIHPADLHLILNLVDSSESFKTAESWTPICLPKFDSNGFMHGHVSYLAEDCQACLLLLTVDRDVFFTLSEAKQVRFQVLIQFKSFLGMSYQHLLTKTLENRGKITANKLLRSNK